MTDKTPPPGPETGRSSATAAAGEDPLLVAFDAARATSADVPDLGESLSARILADAAREAPRPDLTPGRAAQNPSGGIERASRGSGLLGWLTDVLTPQRPAWPGVAAMAGLTACALVGLWIGYAPPTGVETLPAALATGLGFPADAGAGSAADLLAPFDFAELSDV